MSDTPATPSANRYRFRAWHKTEAIMIYDIQSLAFIGKDLTGVVFRYNINAIKTGQNDAKYGFSVDEVVVMQSTGLLDRNGVDMYEGDIVRGKETGVVEWFPQDGAWGVRVDSEAWSYLFTCNLPEKHEVIGNIYENPDLLPKP
ncbi:yopx protein [Caudoviricetes sp.]|nr:yopx protein [Caudoviricetes sp.]